MVKFPAAGSNAPEAIPPPPAPLFSLPMLLAFLLIGLVGGVRMTPPPALERQACWFEIPEDEKADCYLLTPPGARHVAGAWTVRVPVAVLRARRGPAVAAPVVYLEGGPGGSPFDWHFDPDEPADLSEWWPRSAPLRQERDLVLIGQRGTRYAQPPAECGPDDLGRSIRQYGSRHEQWQDWFIERECLERLQWRLVPRDTFSTAALAGDVVDLLDALGQEQADLWGVSYGTTIALEVIAQAPHRVRSAVLDSPFPRHLADIGADARPFDGPLRRLFDDCRADAECRRQAPSLEADFASLLADFNRHPRRLTIDDPVDPGTKIDMRLDGTDLAVLVLYKLGWQASEIAATPRFIMQLYDDWRPALEREFARAPDLIGLFSEQPSFYANAQASIIICREWIFTDAAPAAEQSAASELALALRAALEDRKGCDGIGVPPNGARPTPVAAATPVLVLSGAYDWLTPVGLGRDLLQHFPQARHLVFAETGHAVSWSLDCAIEAMAAFVERPQAPGSPDCLQAGGPPRFLWADPDDAGDD